MAHVGTQGACGAKPSATISQAALLQEISGGRESIMSSIDRKLSLVALLVSLALLITFPACKGFFVNQPNSIAVTTGANGGGSSTFTVAQGSTVQLFATATYNSGNKDVTNSAVWQSSTPCATVTLGSVKGIGATTGVTVTATLSGVGGSATGTVTGSGQGLIISSAPSGPTFTNLTSATFSATLNGTDVTGSTTWTSSSNIVTFQSNVATFSGTGSATITASYVNGTNCNGASENITVQ
jgi:hypothetical protein